MRQTEEFCYSSDEGFDENDPQPNDKKSPIYKIGEYVSPAKIWDKGKEAQISVAVV